MARRGRRRDRATSYRWLRNGQPLPDATAPRLEPGVGQRGDALVRRRSRARDGSDESPWIASAPLTLAERVARDHHAAELRRSGSAAATATRSRRRIRTAIGRSATSWSQGPPGMVVDVANGRVTWRVPPTRRAPTRSSSRCPTRYGGQAAQNYSLAVDWNEVPANASEARRPRPPRRAQGAEDARAGEPERRARSRDAARSRSRPTRTDTEHGSGSGRGGGGRGVLSRGARGLRVADVKLRGRRRLKSPL